MVPLEDAIAVTCYGTTWVLPPSGCAAVVRARRYRPGCACPTREQPPTHRVHSFSRLGCLVAVMRTWGRSCGLALPASCLHRLCPSALSRSQVPYLPKLRTTKRRCSPPLMCRLQPHAALCACAELIDAHLRRRQLALQPAVPHRRERFAHAGATGEPKAFTCL